MSTEQTAPVQYSLVAEIAATLRIFGDEGLQQDLAGHVVVRDTEHPDQFWINPFGVPFAETQPDDLVLVDGSGEILQGKHPVSGFQGQLEVLLAREELHASIHVHSKHLFAWSSVGGTLSALTTESASIRHVQAFRPWDQPSTLEVLGESGRLVIQHFHGAVSFGSTLPEAAFYFRTAERAAETELLLRSAGRFEVVPDSVAERWEVTPDLADRIFRFRIEEEIARAVRTSNEHAARDATWSIHSARSGANVTAQQS